MGLCNIENVNNLCALVADRTRNRGVMLPEYV